MILLEDDKARVRLAPERGALITEYEASGRAVLFLDPETLRDPGKNVRGGVPILFPSPGALVGGRFERSGRAGALSQHGFARNLAWDVVAQSRSDVSLRLRSSEQTLEQFPWEFQVDLRIALQAGMLRLEHVVRNPGAVALPFAFGFHPYFLVREGDKARTRIPTSARRAYDNVQKREVDLGGPIDLAHGEVDLHLIDHGRSSAELQLADGARVSMRASEAYARWVMWTLPGRDFVCLEPWTAPSNALNSGLGLLEVEPGQSMPLWLEVELAP